MLLKITYIIIKSCNLKFQRKINTKSIEFKRQIQKMIKDMERLLHENAI